MIRELAYPIRTLNAPSGVTRIAGAKAYAAKFAHSPRITAACQKRGVSCFYRKLLRDPMPIHHVGFFKYSNPSPSNPCFAAASFRPYNLESAISILCSIHCSCWASYLGGCIPFSWWQNLFLHTMHKSVLHTTRPWMMNFTYQWQARKILPTPIQCTYWMSIDALSPRVTEATNGMLLTYLSSTIADCFKVFRRSLLVFWWRLFPLS